MKAAVSEMQRKYYTGRNYTGKMDVAVTSVVLIRNEYAASRSAAVEQFISRCLGLGVSRALVLLSMLMEDG